MSDWRSIRTAPKDGTRLLAVVPDPDDGELQVRIVSWGKTSHVPMYGFCLRDQGVEESWICEPILWMPMPDLPSEPISRGLVADLASDDDAGELGYEREG